MNLLVSSCTNQCQCYYTLESPLHLRALGLNAFNHPGHIRLTMFPPGYIHVLGKNVTGRFRLPVLVVSCWMEDPWLPTALNLVADILHQCPTIKDLVMDVCVVWLLKHKQLLHLTFWMLRDVMCRQGLSSSACQQR